MKKKTLILIIVAVLLALIVLGVILSMDRNEDREPVNTTEETTQPAQQTIPPTETEIVPVFENKLFTFTGSQFRERFNETLPDGYTFAAQIVNNPARSNNLQLDIINDAGENTGIAILLNVTDPDQTFYQMALMAGADEDPDDFSALSHWFVTTFMVGFSAEDQRVVWESYVELFNSRADDYRLLSVEAHTAMMVRETEETGDQYCVLITVG